MNTAAHLETKTAAPTPRPEVRNEVAKVLTQSSAFARLPPATRQQVARDTALVADYLAAPEGIEGQNIPGGVGMPTASALEGEAPTPPAQESYDQARKAVQEIGGSKFEASAAREGAKVAGLLMKQVNFPTFVAGLIKGVFHAIVESSIEQMQAYSQMVAEVAKSLSNFREDNVTENQGRDHMADKFPDLFEIGTDDFSDNPQPRLKLRDGVDEGDALRRVNSTISFEGGALKSMDLSDADVEAALVTAARTQLARQRQQLLASLVLMGINRIVVTDGRISAKIMYDFQARDTRSLRRSAVAYDYARDAQGNLATTWKGEGEYDTGGDSSYSRDKDSVSRDGNWYAKGKYNYTQQPVVTAMSTASEASDSALQTRAQLAGNVEVNFKSDYLPLEKVATPGMIAAIQGNSTPVDPNVLPSARTPQTSAQTGGAAQPAQQAPAPAAAKT